GAGIADDDGLAAAEVEPCGGRLVGHALGEAENVDEGVLLGLVRKKAGPAEGGTQNCGADGDDGLEARYRIGPEYDLLVAFGYRTLEDGHVITSRSRPASMRRV